MHFVKKYNATIVEAAFLDSPFSLLPSDLMIHARLNLGDFRMAYYSSLFRKVGL